MYVFVMRFLNGMFAPLILVMYTANSSRLALSGTQLIVLIAVVSCCGGIVHTVRLRNTEHIQWELFTCALESILITIVAIVCLSLLVRVGSETLYWGAFAVLFFTVFVFPSYALRWDRSHRTR